jgi:uncharacterized protein (DUF1501 family)
MTPERIPGISRRKFIATSGCAAVGLTTLFSSIINMRAVAAAAMDKRIGMASNDGYKALVCISLSGGADSHNMLVPRSAQAYNVYAATRGNLALPQNDILALNHSPVGGNQYGVHPLMPEVRNLFNAGKLAFISNVGTLVEPVTKQQYLSNSKPLPLGLFSHSDQSMHWQTGRPGERKSYGWGGRIADLIQSQNANQMVSMNISLDGTNQWQMGQQQVEFSMRATGTTGIQGFGTNNIYHNMRDAAINNLLDRDYHDLYEKTYMSTFKNAKEGSDVFQQAISTQPDLAGAFSNTPLSQKLRMVARTISARQSLGHQRQTFFVNFAGWDHHDDTLDSQLTMLPELSKGLAEFFQALEAMGMASNVTTFTISDFGRTLTSNGNGSDHAWGGNMLVMGGDVMGGHIYGEYPLMEMNGPLMLPRGVFIPTTSATEYMSELALWFGLSPGDVVDIFPDLPNFTSNPGAYPVGFMNPGT